MLTVILIIFFVYFIGAHVGLYLIYEKMGQPGWKALVPVYGFWTRIELTGRPKHWIIYYFIPIVNLFCWYYMVFDLLKSYGKTSFLDHFYTAIIPFIYLVNIGRSEDLEYRGKASELPKIEKSQGREWGDAILFAVIAASLIRWSVMEAYTIPTPSMENSLLVGDFLFVSKFHYGTRTPGTPLQIPLTHQMFPGTKIKSYSDLIQIPQFRLPGLSKIKNNDVVVFNFPANFNGGDGHDRNNRSRPVDLRTNYIKRCIGIPGDVIEVKDGKPFVNGNPTTAPEGMLMPYYVETTGVLPKRVLDKYEIGSTNSREIQGGMIYSMYITPKQVDLLTNDTMVNNISPINTDREIIEGNIYPNGSPWNVDWYGPIEVPAEGQTIELNSETIARYGEVIKYYEGHDNVVYDSTKLLIDGSEITEYTFKQNYYFMMGDNRHNSWDSRFFGFVPEDHVVGKAYFIWLSLDENKSLFNGKIRWNRFLQIIE